MTREEEFIDNVEQVIIKLRAPNTTLSTEEAMSQILDLYDKMEYEYRYREDEE